ncbi:MAG TPA: hypothetical protein VG457_13780 [Planctomycetota bacterium]|nr:hypothetical protein [Planctomycetota bacterium]
MLCGFLIGIDFVDWLRARMDLLDPVGILGFLGFYMFLLAPLLHVSLDYWMPYITPPPDWREWLGKMGIFNAGGLCVYAVVTRLWKAPRSPRQPRTLVHKPAFYLTTALVLTAAMQTYVYIHFGGINGYVDLFVAETDMGKSSFTGWGWIFIVSESFPRLAFMAFALSMWKLQQRPSWGWIAGAFAVFFGLLILFGGLRGSRSNFVWSLFWAVGVTHLCIRSIPRRIVFPGVAALLAFMVVYSAYKHGGTKDFERVMKGEKSERGSSLTQVALGDLSRSDVQAFLYYRMSRAGSDYELAGGRTYLAALTLLIPQALWPDRPPTKVHEGTWILWGKDAVIYGDASNLYGLAGEGMLNFGPGFVPLAFGVFGLLVHAVRSFVYRLHPRDSRIFLLPVFVSLCILGLVCDSDNVVFFLFQYGTPVAATLMFISRPFRKPAMTPVLDGGI